MEAAADHGTSIGSSNTREVSMCVRPILRPTIRGLFHDRMTSSKKQAKAQGYDAMALQGPVAHALAPPAL
jgi:hypothetical protein